MSITSRQPSARNFMIPFEQLVVAKEEDSVLGVLEVLTRTDFARRRCFVVNSEQKCIGMVGLATLSRAYYDRRNPETTRIAEIMKRNFGTVSPMATVDQCRELMGRMRLHHLVVTEDGKATGKLLGAVSSWLVAQEQSVQVKPYPHNVLARNYTTFWQKLPDSELKIKRSKL
eukprot:Sspe_Gene.3531::Locus_1170_Transcript_1_1_Confidence_1.000_Length_984::g.3531::m.3531